MRDFVRSMMRFPLLASTFGLKQLASVLTAAPLAEGREGPAYEATLDRAEAQFNRLMREAFKTGDRLSEDMVDPLLGMLPGQTMTSDRFLKTGFDATRKAAESLGTWMSASEDPWAWQEFCNKLASFGTFRYVASVLNLDAKADFPLAEWAQKAAELEPYMSVWATEGLGHYWAEKAWREGGTPRDLLTGGPSDALRPGSLVALHAGMGLSLAKHALAPLGPQSSPEAIRDALRRFVDLCAANARAGYQEVALEALGLVAQTFYPALILPVDRQLPEVAPEVQDYFWHGAGRGAYFTPRSSSAWRRGTLLRLRVPHAQGRLNMISGLAWPLTLVNIRHPEIVARFLVRHGRDVSEHDAFANGVSASIMVWFNITQGDPHLDQFRQHRVNPANQALVRTWQEQIQAPVEAGLTHHYGVIREHNCFGELFQYQSLPDLVDRLERSPSV